MLRSQLLAVALVVLAMFGVAGAAGGPSTAITDAALAPYRDELLRNAPALCSDLTKPPTTVPEAPAGESCEQVVQGVFAAAGPPSLPQDAVLSMRASASHLKIDGQRATGIFSLVATEPASVHGTPGVRIVSLGRFELSLEEVAGRWLVSSEARLAAIDCQPSAHRRCRPGVKSVLFTLGLPLGQTQEEEIPTPAAVRRASSRERREFAAGRTVFLQSGCLGCHKIGHVGNRGPGQNLTHIGSQLSTAQIERAIRSPRAPMPSFTRLPARKWHDLVRFLALLR